MGDQINNHENCPNTSHSGVNHIQSGTFRQPASTSPYVRRRGRTINVVDAIPVNNQEVVQQRQQQIHNNNKTYLIIVLIFLAFLFSIALIAMAINSSKNSEPNIQIELDKSISNTKNEMYKLNEYYDGNCKNTNKTISFNSQKLKELEKELNKLQKKDSIIEKLQNYFNKTQIDLKKLANNNKNEIEVINAKLNVIFLHLENIKKVREQLSERVEKNKP